MICRVPSCLIAILVIQRFFEAQKVLPKGENGILFITTKSLKVQLVTIALAGIAVI